MRGVSLGEELTIEKAIALEEQAAARQWGMIAIDARLIAADRVG